MSGDEPAAGRPREPAADRQRQAAEVLERRYRRLLAGYPADYRAANADDMLAVALARSEPGRRWPEFGEAVNLILSGARRRLVAGLRNPVRRDTAAVVAIIGPILLAAASLWGVFTPYPFIGSLAKPVQTTISLGAMAIWWLLMAVAGMLRWRRLAAAGACACLVALLALAIAGILWSDLVFGGLVLLALLVVAAALVGIGTEVRPLSWPEVAAITVAAAMVPGWPIAERASESTQRVAAGGWAPYSPLTGNIVFWCDAALACSVIVMTLATGWLRPAVRRRVVAVLVPVLAAMALVCWRDGDIFTAVPLLEILRNPLGWLDLVLTTAAGLAVGQVGVTLCKHARRRFAAGRSTT